MTKLITVIAASLSMAAAGVLGLTGPTAENPVVIEVADSCTCCDCGDSCACDTCECCGCGDTCSCWCEEGAYDDCDGACAEPSSCCEAEAACCNG